MDSHGIAASYDAYYYAHGCGEPYQRNASWLDFFGGVADRIIKDIQPQTVLDAGCAMGFLVESLRARGVEAFGMDLSQYAIQNVHRSIQPYCVIGSVAEPLDRRYDLIVCIEVLEHLAPREAERAVENFCQHTPNVLFSSTPIDYKEATHFNVQPPEYWAELFARQDFFRDLEFDASFLTPWAAFFRSRHDPVHRIIREYERKFWLFQKENSDLRSSTREMRDQLSAKDQEIQTLRSQIAEMSNTESWRLVKQLQSGQHRLAPPNSFRKRLLDKFVRKLLEHS